MSHLCIVQFIYSIGAHTLTPYFAKKNIKFMNNTVSY